MSERNERADRATYFIKMAEQREREAENALKQAAEYRALAARLTASASDFARDDMNEKAIEAAASWARQNAHKSTQSKWEGDYVDWNTIATGMLTAASAALPPLRAREEIAREFEEAREFVRNLWRNNDVGKDQHYEIIARLDELEKSTLSGAAGQEWRAPDGWQLVPKHPTIDMVEAGCTVHLNHYGVGVMPCVVHYRIMLATAPPVAEPLLADKSQP